MEKGLLEKYIEQTFINIHMAILCTKMQLGFCFDSVWMIQ